MKNLIRDIMYDQRKGYWIDYLKAFFLLLSRIFRYGVLCRDMAFKRGWKKSYALVKPVISVGNITVGGVGKTPMTIYLAEEIKKLGKRPAILTRGYMRDLDSGSDEAKMMLHKLKDVPVLVGSDRYQEGMSFLTDDECDVFIMDDGFQHRRLNRDLNIVLMDATNPWGNGHLIPRGILREPLASLERADIIVLTRTDQAGEQVAEIKRKVHEICPDKLYCESIHAPKNLYNLQAKERLDLKMIKGKSLYVVSSIAYPQAFERTLMKLGGQIDGASHFLDHHVYDEGNIRQLLSDIHFQKVDYVLTTEKDEPKLNQWVERFEGVSLLSLRIELSLQLGKDELLERVASLLDR